MSKVYKVWVDSISIESCDHETGEYKEVAPEQVKAICIGEYATLKEAKERCTEIDKSGLVSM